MAKRKLPPHIVLPNGQWRFVKRGSKKTGRKKTGGRMARKGVYRRRARGLLGSSGGLIKPLAVGALIGVFGDKIPMLGTIEPMATGAAAGYLVKKNLMGAGAGAAGGYIGSRYIKPMLGTGTGGSAW